jgi:hypothetical protein
MNIKRRVYDALNVLIALGLLKRNGNKILGKKPESDSISLERDKQSTPRPTQDARRRVSRRNSNTCVASTCSGEKPSATSSR